jgi:iron complex outermembrane receptor protein
MMGRSASGQPATEWGSKLKRSSLRTAATVALAALSAQPLAARQEEPDSVIELEPVMVRLLRGPVGVGSVAPISVVSGPTLTRATQGAFIEDAVRAIPGVQIQNRYNLAVGERIAVRGFGPRAQFGVRGVRILVDGIPATLPDGQATLDHLDLSSVGRVEALRGPASSLYGNAAGGVIHFQTLDPADEPAAVTLRSTSSGSDGPWPLRPNLYTVQGAVTGSVEDVGYRVSATRLSYDGYRLDPVADDGSAYGAGRRTVLNGTLTLPVAGGSMRVVMNGVDMFAENPGSLNQIVLDEGDRSAHVGNIAIGAVKDVRQGQLGTSWNGSIGTTDTELAVWGIRRELYNPIPGTVVDLDRNAGGLRALAQRSSDTGSGTLGLGLGFEVETQHDDRLNRENNGGQPGITTLDQNETVRGIGLFAQGRFDLPAGLSVIAGLRYDRIRYSVDDHLVGFSDPDESGSRTMDAISPSAGVVYRATPRLELFGSVARSFETPTTTELANRPDGSGGFNPELEPQLGLTFEGGVRADLGTAWLAEGTIYQTTLTDGLIPFEENDRTFYRNAAETKHVGWEVSLDGRLTPWATLRLAYTRVDAEYEMFETDTEVFSGNKVPGLAPNRVDGVLTLQSDLGYVELRGLFQDEMSVDDDGTAFSDSYFISDVRIGSTELELEGALLQPFIGIANLFDERYVSSVVPNAFGGRYYEPGPARTYQIGLGVTWGR